MLATPEDPSQRGQDSEHGLTPRARFREGPLGPCRSAPTCLALP